MNRAISSFIQHRFLRIAKYGGVLFLVYLILNKDTESKHIKNVIRDTNSARDSDPILQEPVPLKFDIKVPPPIITKTTNANGYSKFSVVYETLNICEKLVAILTIVNDHTSWGQGGRTFKDFMDMAFTINYPKICQTINILVSSEVEFKSMIQYVKSNDKLGYHSITLFLQPTAALSSREGRKEDALQKNRRRLLAILRNQLLYSILTIHIYGVLWIDSDIIKVPVDALAKIIDADKDIVAALCTKGGGEYDLNSWSGPRLAPNAEEWKDINAGKLFVPRPTGETKFMNGWRNKDEPFMSLDSVGGTYLYVKADIHRSGIAFTTLYVVGTDWERAEGYDGIETEGICYVAKAAGYKCWGMPFEEVFHSIG